MALSFNTFSLFMLHRSQLSICSEPTVAIKQLSCQSSIEPCVLEEDIYDDREYFNSPQDSQAAIESTVVTIENDNLQRNSTRPDSLILNTTTIEDSTKPSDNKKYLYRSQSTKSFKKPKLKTTKVLSNDLDQIYVISSNSCMRSNLNDFYDSINVIHERRSKNFSKFCESASDVNVVTLSENTIETIVDIETHRK